MRLMQREILRLSATNILSNIVIPLVGMVDVAIMGHLGSDIYIGAVALGSMIFNFLYWGFGFLRMGTTGFAAQANGTGNRQEMMAVLARGALLAGSAASILLLFQHPIGKLAFLLIRAPEAVEAEAMIYYSVRIWAAPATLMLYVFYGWFIGMQNTVIPATIAIVVSIVNMAASYLLVYRFGMTADGVALGTVIAQYTGAVLAITVLLTRYRKMLPFPPWRHVAQRIALVKMMRVNSDIFIRTLCLIAVMTYFTGRSAYYGSQILAVNTLLFQFFIFFSYFIDGFAYAGEALTGRLIGAKDRTGLATMLKTLFRWGAVMSLLFTLGYLLLGNQLPAILTNDPETIAATNPYLFWTIIIPVVSFAAFLWDGVFIGATAGAPMRNVMIVASVAVFFPAYFLLDPIIGNHALWLAFLLFLAARSTGMSLLAKRVISDYV